MIRESRQQGAISRVLGPTALASERNATEVEEQVLTRENSIRMVAMCCSTVGGAAWRCKVSM
jgi:hypothetical protein